MSSLFKNTYRELLRSPGRFLAILAIIVLGSGFFVGLRVSQKAMTATADRYLDKTDFFDFSVTNTLGMTNEDVDAFLADDMVLDAEGGFQLDALVNTGSETDLVYAFYSLPERINLPDVIEGRLPEAPGECLADSWSPLHPGDRVRVSEFNDEDTLELFTVSEFTVVGVATSPLYLNFERGSTSLGSGSVSAFCYVMPEVFDADYYTSVYIRCPDMPAAYSDEYDQRSEAMEDRFTALAEARADVRYTSIVSDAEAELRDGWIEYNDGYREYVMERADAESELENARLELEDAKRELDDAAAEIADGEQEIADGKETLRSSERQLRDAKRKLDDAAAQIADGEEELARGWEEYNDGLAAFEEERDSAQRELLDAKAKLDDAESTLSEGEREYEENLKLYEDGERQYNSGLAQYNSGAAELEQNEDKYAQGLEEYNENLAKFEAGEADLADGKAKLDAGKAVLDESQAQFDQLTGAILEGINEQLPAYGLPPYESVEALLDALESGNFIAVYAVNQALMIAAERNPGMDIPADSTQLLALRAQLEVGWAEYNDNLALYEENAAALEAARAELESAKALLDDSRAQLDDGWAQLEAAVAVLVSSRQELDEARRQLQDGRQELDDGWAEYREGLEEYESGVEKFNTSIAEAQAELDSARLELEDAEAELAQGRIDYETGLQEYEDGLDKYYDGRRDLADAEAELADARQKYQDGLDEYEEGLREYEDAKSEADAEFADAEAELADARQELADAREDIDSIAYPDAYLLGRWSNVGYACFESDSSIVRSISSVFPVFFFLVAALICVTSVTRMVEEQRSQLGVLMALGYSPLAIMGKFLIWSGSATVLGGVAGMLLGSRLIPLVVWQAYKIMYSFSDEIVFYYDLRLATVTFCLYLGSMLLVTYLACRREISDVPANVIRPRAPKAGKRVLLEKVPFIWNRLSFLWKVTVRNIFRYKLRVMMMILGVAGCTALMLTGMGINDSIKNVVDYQFNEISLYDYTVTFADDLTAEEREEFLEDAEKFAQSALFLHQSSVTASANRTEKEVLLNAVEDGRLEEIGSFIDFHRGSAPLPFPGEGQVLVNSGLAEAMDLSVGDTLELRDDDGLGLTLTVSGIYDNYIYNNIYITSSTYAASAGGDPEINFALVDKAEDISTGEALAAILSMDNVLTASASQDLRDRIGSMMESLIYIVILTVVCAAALAFVVIYNLTNINIQERLRELATVKVLGFYDGESALYVLRENVLLTVLGVAAGVPMGLALNAFVVGEIDIDLIHFSPRVLFPSYVWSILLTFIFSFLVDLVMSGRLSKIDPASALKAAE